MRIHKKLPLCYCLTLLLENDFSYEKINNVHGLRITKVKVKLVFVFILVEQVDIENRLRLLRKGQ